MDRSLATFLRSLQSSPSHEDAHRLLPSATSLLQRLSNPLNISLLSSQLLVTQSLYLRPVDLASCRQIFTTFYSAAFRFVQAEAANDPPVPRSHLSRRAWAKAVIQGADDRSPRWRHVLLLGGLLLGFEGQNEKQLPTDLREKLELALVTASNLALERQDEFEPNCHLGVIWTLNETFPYISDHHRALLAYNALLPLSLDAAFFSRDGLEHGYWLSSVDADIRPASNNQFHWSLRSPSAMRIQSIRSRGLVASISRLSRLIAHTIENVNDANLIVASVDRLVGFAHNLALSWRQTKLSELDQKEEKEFLDRETLENSLPILLHMLRDTFFAIVILLRAVFGRLLVDRQLAIRGPAAALAIKCLHICRDLYFISHRFGQNSLSQYSFVNYTAIDILNQYPQQAESFLTTIRPANNQVSVHPLDRLHDLYFLNTAEHFTLSLPPSATEHLVVNAALPYVKPKGDRRLNELYEAAHSVLLAVFCTPRNAELAARHLPSYVEILLQSFPDPLSPRQFRLAVKSIAELSAPPSALAVSMPFLQATVLEMLQVRGVVASEDLLPADDLATDEPLPLSEKSVVLLSMIDSLPFLPVPVLEDWLPIVAEQIHKIVDPRQRSLCQRRIWGVLNDGEMDVDRAATCVAWWTSRGGRELVLHGDLPDDDYLMSGSLQESKL